MCKFAICLFLLFFLFITLFILCIFFFFSVCVLLAIKNIYIYFIWRLRKQSHGQHLRDSLGYLDWFSPHNFPFQQKYIVKPIDIFTELLIRQSPRDSQTSYNTNCLQWSYLRSHQCDRMWFQISRDTTREWPKSKRRDTINQLCNTHGHQPPSRRGGCYTLNNILI